MPKGFDTTVNCQTQAAAIKANGIDFLARYLSRSHWKAITQPEAAALKAAGLAIVLVYEDNPTCSGYFSVEQGLEDGTRAAQQAALLGAASSTAIYFAVDYDATEGDITACVVPYFQGVANGLKFYAASNNVAFEPAVYGSGLTCSMLLHAGFANRAWLAQSSGWQGFSTFTQWNIKQLMPSTILNMSVDPDIATNDTGAM